MTGLRHRATPPWQRKVFRNLGAARHSTLTPKLAKASSGRNESEGNTLHFEKRIQPRCPYPDSAGKFLGIVNEVLSL
jgi:hypothetical protein